MSTTPLAGRTVLVTGANGGLGQEFVAGALARGAAKVYAAARTPRSWESPLVEPLHLDLTGPESIAAAAARAGDVDLRVNNAAIAPEGDSITGSVEDARRVFETNFFGTLQVANAFAPVLASHGGGTMLNVISSAAWVSVPTVYGASKAALWSASNGLRLALEGQGTHVVSLLVGMVDTPMSQRWDVAKVTAASVVDQAYDGVVNGALEVLADEETRGLKVQLGTPAEEFYPRVHEQLAFFKA
ncbi:SDR family NAD(P)-dependent oxidoreductase [Nocardioides anomalus]|uniref:SDR family NAD(P)-dependent oxidoreductase n=1 Tax=Nocardioides anomalus TaxID=2712223 RepID=A0A6G6WGW7_9ACTN|nr:SDR family oxidoreductase [Nocardioides anomalus]QIG44300.1 SDR family NAD(P)-dependent oxidoreductase [Nocardioides anomalus]